MCDTTWWFRGNCSGKCKPCPFKCNYSFCEYHGAPVTTIATPIGGHVCSKVTAGTGIVGDNIFDMAANCVMLATTGPGGYATAKASAMMLDAALEEVANKTPGGPQLKKLNALRQKLQGAINGSPAAILSCIKDVNEALR